ncbi:MAG: integrase/recombinase XerC [Alphaproteobacteria bacterium]|jgi:integrase/recombinase XerC
MSLIYSDPFFDYLCIEKRASRHTALAYKRDLEIFRQFIESYLGKEADNDTLKNLNVDQLQAFITHGILKEKVSKQTVNRRLSSIKSFFKWLKRKNILQNDHVQLVKNIKAQTAPPKALQKSDILNILKKLRPPSENADMHEKRDYCLVLVLYGLGLRISEALSINAEDIQGERINIIGKGNKERSLPLPKPVKLAMIDLASDLPKSAKSCPLFINQRFAARLSARAAQMILKRVRNELGLAEHLTPHTLRHCFATHMLENGADIRTIQELLGHESLSATQRYLAINARELKDAHDNAHPLNKRDA